ncbi:MAG: DUF1656 domain-containing protein [Verrucomicrobiales bacterium]|jgi:hypothetical protein|nr:DUF1656 domain-containing protein [Verrucomicrobiales bacterium]
MRELNIFGIFVTPMVAYLIVAAVLYFIVRRWLRRFRPEQYFWHPKLVEFCVFLIILSLVVFVSLV